MMGDVIPSWYLIQNRKTENLGSLEKDGETVLFDLSTWKL